MPNVPRPDAPDAYLSQQVAIENREIAQKINGYISLGRGVNTERAGNINAQYLRYTFSGKANEELTVWHGLGRVPVGYLAVEMDQAGTVYSSRRGSWTSTVMYLKSDAPFHDVLLMVW